MPTRGEYVYSDSADKFDRWRIKTDSVIEDQNSIKNKENDFVSDLNIDSDEVVNFISDDEDITINIEEKNDSSVEIHLKSGKWAGAAKFVSSTGPDPAQGENGDIWFVIEE